jgi:hypothetical protein
MQRVPLPNEMEKQFARPHENPQLAGIRETLQMQKVYV